MNKLKAALVRLSVVCILMGSFVAQIYASEVALMPTPAQANTSLGRLVMGADDQLYMSWVEITDGQSKLYYAQLNDGIWQDAVLIAQGDDWFVNWADFPALSVNKNSKVAHWLKMSSEGTYDYNVSAVFCSDGKGFGAPIIVHEDGVSAEHGFVSMVPLSQERTFITWLDGRNTKPSAAVKTKDKHAGGMTLHAAIFDQSGQALEDWELDNRTCDCCQTSTAMSENGPIVVYRDRTNDEIRDIYVTRLVGDKWSEPKAIHHDGWRVAGCPVNGPDIDSKNGLTAVAWFTAKDDNAKVQMAISKDGAETFSAPLLIAKGNTSGRVSITILDSGNIAVSWLETAGKEAKIKLGLFDKTGALKEILTIANTSASRRSGFPILASLGNQVYVTWTDIDGGSQVKVATTTF